MKTKQDIEEYRECVRLAEIETINFLGRVLNKGCYFTLDEIEEGTNVNPVFVRIALNNIIMKNGTHVVKVPIVTYNAIQQQSVVVYHYGWE